MLLLATAWVVEPYAVAFWVSATSPRAVTPRADLTEAERITIRVFQTASPSVVHVFARASPGFSLFAPATSVVQSGSGILWDAAGHVMTNNHVISGANEIGAHFPSGGLVATRLVGAAPNYDIAVLQVERAALRAAPDSRGPIGRFASRPVRLRVRPPLRPRANLDLRDHQRAKPPIADLDALRDCRRYPKRMPR